MTKGNESDGKGTPFFDGVFEWAGFGRGSDSDGDFFHSRVSVWQQKSVGNRDCEGVLRIIFLRKTLY